MSQFINILCKKSCGITRREIVRGTEEFWYEDAPILFHPTELDHEIDNLDWTELTLTFPSSNRPVIIQRFGVGRFSSDLIDEVRSETESLPMKVDSHLNDVNEVISIEIFPETLDDDLWEYLDLVESFIARKLEGIIVTDDGVYDENLKLIA